jgi:hypothetical protein
MMRTTGSAEPPLGESVRSDFYYEFLRLHLEVQLLKQTLTQMLKRETRAKPVTHRQRRSLKRKTN